MAAVAWVLASLVGFAAGLLPTVVNAAYRWDNVAIHGGGFVSGLVFHPSEPGLLYARTDVGGAYRQDAATGRWVPLNDDLGGLDNAFMELGVASIALDPQDPDRVYLACGQYLAWWAPAATVLRSTDRGATWARTTLPFKLGGNSDGRNTGERLVVDPHLGSTLLLGTWDAGLWRSTNSGASFTQLTTFPAAGVTWMLFDPRSGTPGVATPVIYAGAHVAGPGAPSVFRSLDGGATWAAVPGQPLALPIPASDPTRPSQPIPHHAAFAGDAHGRLFLTYSNALGPNGASTGAVWRYNPVTEAWDNITPTPAPPSQQGGFGGVSVSAQNPALVVVSTLDRWWPGDEVYRSTDGGATWSARLTTASRDNSSAPWAGTLGAHWIGDIELDPTNADRALFVTGFGIYRTQQLAAGAPVWSFYNAGLEETVPLGLVSPPSGPPLVSVIGDFDGFRHDSLLLSPPAGRHAPHRGTTRSLAFAELAPGVMARTFYNGTRGARSTDGGASWTEFASAPSTAADPGQITVGADGTRFVWIQPGLVPHVSTNHGAAWTAATGSVPAGEHTPVADRVAPLRFYVYDGGTGTLHRSADGGASFSPAATGLPTSASAPVASPGFEGHLWLPAWNSGLRRSVDGGGTFAPVASVQRAYRLGFGRAAAGQPYPALYLWGRVASIDGLWRSVDQAATWERINDPAHNFGHINVLTGDPRVFGRIYLGTSGRGIIYGEPDDTPPPSLALPEGWTHRDIGAPAIPGQAYATDGTFTLAASGSDIWSNYDQFHFASRSIDGDATLIARVTSLTNTDTWAKAGVMFRAGTAADAACVYLVQRPDNLVTLQWRTAAGAFAQTTAGSGLFGTTTAVKWLRLVRSGHTFTAAYSTNGTAWTTIPTVPTVVLPRTIEAGLCLTSHAPAALATATFTGVALTPESLAVTTPDPLPTAHVGLPFAVTLEARGGFPAYTWALDAGELPSGVTLDADTGELTGTPAATGIHGFTARVTDAAGTTATRSHALSVLGLPYAAWLDLHFTAAEQANPLVGGAPSADPEADGLPNLAEWALDLDPRAPDAGRALRTADVPGAAPGTRDFLVTFTRRRAAPGVAWAVETSASLVAPWATVPEGDPTWSIVDDGNGRTETVTVRLPVAAGARLFARLRVTTP